MVIYSKHTITMWQGLGSEKVFSAMQKTHQGEKTADRALFKYWEILILMSHLFIKYVLKCMSLMSSCLLLYYFEKKKKNSQVKFSYILAGSEHAKHIRTSLLIILFLIKLVNKICFNPTSVSYKDPFYVILVNHLQEDGFKW